MNTTFDGLRDIIVRDFELAPERLLRATLLEEIELDSLSVTELVFALEDEFHVTAGNVNPGFKNLGDIADYIDQLIAERDAPPKAARKPTANARRAAPPRLAPASRVAEPKPSRSAKTGARPGAQKNRATNGAGAANGRKPRAASAAPRGTPPRAAAPRKRKGPSAATGGARTR